MKRLSIIACVLLMLVSGVLALTESEAQPLQGEVLYPQGSAADSAAFSYRYRLPQFTQEQPQADAINAYFSAYEKELLESIIPETVNALDSLPAAGEPEFFVDVDYRITASDADRLSVVLVSQRFLGNTLVESWDSVVFALSSVYAGQPLTLAQAMGLEQEEAETVGDPASELVYGLVWQIVSYEIGAMQKAYFPDLTEEEFRSAFSPQQDFYFDGDGNFVFFIQAGTIASEVEGVLTYPFSMAELLSAIGQG